MKLYPVPVVVLLIFGMAIATCPAQAQSADDKQGFARWLAQVEHDAIAQGVPASIVESALRGVTPLPRVIELDRRQPETTLTFQQYVSRVVVPDKIAAGRKLRVQNRKLLRSVSDRYGVSPKIIMALWAIESGYGHAMGDTRVVDSLATLAFDGRRPDLFRAELIAALKILGRGRFDSGMLKGSWAGAMGQVQFMPSTYLQYAVNYGHQGEPDIWRDTADVFASAANYLSALGWKREENWGREVKLPARFDAGQLGLPVQRTVAEWGKQGVRRVDGGPLPQSAIEGSVIAPDGVGGRAFLVYDNFRAIMKWNRSTYFALAVGLLGDAIGN
jgi:membrane-bound lytic murein transglycosylase B